MLGKVSMALTFEIFVMFLTVEAVGLKIIAW
jgi:hypothetical protein